MKPTVEITAQTAVRALRERARRLRLWLRANCPECDKEQAHLGRGSRERAYWHYGYLVALRDALALIGAKKKSPR